MTEDEFKSFVSAEIADALAYIDTDIASRRERYLDYYAGIMSDLPVGKGQSSVTDRTLADNVNLMLPMLMRIFTSGRHVSEFEATDPKLDDVMSDITEYADDVLKKKNGGENLLYQWAWEALVQIVGVVKSYWKEDIQYEKETLEGLDQNQLAQLLMRIEQTPDLEVTNHTENREDVDAVDEFGIPIVAEHITHDVTVTKTINKSHIVSELVPGDEFVISADARSLEDGNLKSHRTTKTVGELIDMGFDREVVEGLPTFARYELSDIGGHTQNSESTDPMMREVAVHQGVVRCDFDGDGVKDWYFTIAGDEKTAEILELEEFDNQVEFADFCPNPLPSMFFGRCPADDLAEVQKVKAALTRQMLNSLYLSTSPQREVVWSNILNPDDLSTFAPAAPIRVKQAGTVREVAVPFVGQHALTGLQYFDQVAEARTGVSKASMGLAPEVLQNQSATAANIAQSASMGKVEMIARIWGNGGLRKYFLGIFRIAKKYQDFPSLIRVGNETKQINPADWAHITEEMFDVRTGVGSGVRERDLQMLSALAQWQEAVYAQRGESQPLVSVGHIAHTRRRMIEVSGLGDPDSFVNDVPMNWKPQPQPPRPDPKLVLEQQKSEAQMQMNAQKAQADLQQAEQKAMLDAEIARQKAAQEAQIAQERAEADARLAGEKIAAEREVAIERLAIDAQLKREELAMEFELEKLKMANKSPDGQGNLPGSD